MADSKQFEKLEFVAFCIEQYKKETHQKGSEVEQLFQQHHVIQFLTDHYEILHTQSAPSIQAEIIEYLNHH